MLRIPKEPPPTPIPPSPTSHQSLSGCVLPLFMNNGCQGMKEREEVTAKKERARDERERDSERDRECERERDSERDRER